MFAGATAICLCSSSYLFSMLISACHEYNFLPQQPLVQKNTEKRKESEMCIHLYIHLRVNLKSHGGPSQWLTHTIHRDIHDLECLSINNHVTLTPLNSSRDYKKGYKTITKTILICVYRCTCMHRYMYMTKKEMHVTNHKRLTRLKCHNDVYFSLDISIWLE